MIVKATVIVDIAAFF